VLPCDIEPMTQAETAGEFDERDGGKRGPATSTVPSPISPD
jgi:hypothetical protein